MSQIGGNGRSIGPPSGSVKLMGDEALSVAVSSRKIGQTCSGSFVSSYSRAA